MKARGLLRDVLLSTQTDERLCALVGGGNASAFAELTQRHRAALLRTASHVAGESGAEDAVQDGLLRAWAGLSGGIEVRQPRAWLHQIVRNTAIDHVRRRVGMQPLPDDLSAPQSVAEQLASRDLARSVLAEIAALPERQREALIATEFGDQTRREIAAELGITEGAVRQLVHRARDSLRLAFSALVPFPLLAWLVRPRVGLMERLARSLTAGNGSGVGQSLLTGPRGGGAIVRGGAVLLAAGAAGTVVIPRISGPARHPRAVAQPRSSGLTSRAGLSGLPRYLLSAAAPSGLEPEITALAQEDGGGLLGSDSTEAAGSSRGLDGMSGSDRGQHGSPAGDGSSSERTRSGAGSGDAGGGALTADGTAAPTGAAAPPAGSTEQSAGGTDQTAGTTSQSAGSTDQTAGTTSQPAGSTDQTAGTTSQTAGSTDQTGALQPATAGSSSGSSGGGVTTTTPTSTAPAASTDQSGSSQSSPSQSSSDTTSSTDS